MPKSRKDLLARWKYLVLLVLLLDELSEFQKGIALENWI
jgi:hypothetical protein